MKKLFFCEVTDEEFQKATDYLAESIINIPKKPPIGIKPRYIHNEERRIEIESAIQRYYNADLLVPKEWYEELNELKHGEGASQ